MIMAFNFRVNFPRLQLAGGQACTLVRDLKLFSVISRSETAKTCIHSISIHADAHDDHLKINIFLGSIIIVHLRRGYRF